MTCTALIQAESIELRIYARVGTNSFFEFVDELDQIMRPAVAASLDGMARYAQAISSRYGFTEVTFDYVMKTTFEIDRAVP